MAQATTYLRISALGIPAMLVVLATTGVLRGLQDTRTPLLAAVAGFSVNIALNLWFVHGLGWALTESFVYDDQCQLLTGTFMDYLPPRFSDIPPLQMGHVECPTPFSPLGAKGMGEGGAIPTPTCIANAVEDAIAHLGGRLDDSHLTPERVLAAIRASRQQGWSA